MLFVGTKIAFAFMPQFGGRIIHTKAIEIQTLEMAGFLCYAPGSTISIVPIGSPLGTPTSYLIPFGVTSKTRISPRAGQLIIGKRSGKMVINCTLAYFPFTTIPVSLDTVFLFGNSRI